MLLDGMALVGGRRRLPRRNLVIAVDQEVGTHASAAGAVLGIG